MHKLGSINYKISIILLYFNCFSLGFYRCMLLYIHTKLNPNFIIYTQTSNPTFLFTLRYLNPFHLIMHHMSTFTYSDINTHNVYTMSIHQVFNIFQTPLLWQTEYRHLWWPRVLPHHFLPFVPSFLFTISSHISTESHTRATPHEHMPVILIFC